jgi:hypothetical protein
MPLNQRSHFNASTPSSVSALQERDGIGFGWQSVVYLLVLAALFTRRPDMFLHAQFYAEDGKYWYAQAYNLGWVRALGIPLGGYLNILSRLVGALSLLVPFRDAPLVMNLAGVVIQALPVMALLSARCRTWGSLPLRMVMAAIYVAIPNAWEVHVVLTNAHWHLFVLEMLIAFGVPPRGWLGRVGDVVLFAVGGVSDPFCILLLPLVLFYWWRTRERWTLVIAAITGCGAVVQLFTIMRSVRPSNGPLGATPGLLLRFLAGDIVVDSMTGLRSVVERIPVPALVAILIFAMLIVGYGFFRGKLAFRLYIVFAGALLVTALRNPLIDGPHPLWQMLLDDFGCRYWYYPMLAFLWSAAWCIFHGRSRVVRLAGYCVLIPMLFGVVKDWRYRTPADYHFGVYVERFARERAGDHLVIPLNPYPLSMELVKK